MKQMTFMNSKRSNLIVIIPFLLITAFFFVLYFIYPKQIKSETENRLLAQRPILTHENILSFPRNFEKYYNDQFPYRESFLKMFSRIELSLGKTIIRDLYISKGFLLPQEYQYSQSDVSKSAEKTNALMNFVVSTGKKGGYIALPYKTSVYNYMLPTYLQNNYGELNYEHFVNQLDARIKVCDAFRCYEGQTSSEVEEYFFKTDLHWNVKGAGVAFNYILDWLYEEKLINTPIKNDELFNYSYIDNAKYLGDLNRRYSFLFSTNESIPVFKDTDKKVKYYLSYFEDEYTLDTDSIKDRSVNEATQTYNSVYSNNLGYYKMVNEDSLLDTKVLVIKDSMQNAMTDMFLQVFNTTEVIDIRSLKEVELYQIIKESKADFVLLMYHQDNITGDMFNFM